MLLTVNRHLSLDGDYAATNKAYNSFPQRIYYSDYAVCSGFW